MSDKEVKYWKNAYETKAKEFAELQNTYKEFQQSSHEFENELEEELAQAQVENDRLKARLSKSESQLRKAREELERLRASANAEIMTLQEKLQLVGDGKEAVSDVDRVQRLIQEKNEVSRQAAEDISALQEQLDAIHEKYEVLEAEAEELKESKEEEINRLKSDIRELKAELITSKPNADKDKTTPVIASDSKYVEVIAQLKDEIKVLHSKIEQLSQDKDQLEARLLEESELNEELTGEVSDLTDDFMANSDRIEQLETLLREAQEQLVTLQNSASATAAQPSTTVAVSSGPSNPEAARQLQASQERLQVLEEQIELLEKQLKEQTDLNQELSADFANLTEQSEQTARKMAAAQSKQEDQQRALQLAESKVQQLEEELFEANTKVSEALGKLQEAEQRLGDAQKSLQTQATEGLDKMQSLERQYQDLQVRLESVDELEGKYKAELQKQQKAYDELVAEKNREANLRAKLREERSRLESEALQKIGKKGGKGAKLSTGIMLLKGSVSGMASDVSRSTDEIRAGFMQLNRAVGDLGLLVKSAQDNYVAELNQRKKLFDNLQDLKGNIRVFCRVRPLLRSEKENGMEESVEFPGNDQIAFTRNVNKADSKPFQFDRVYPAHIDQVEVFQDIKDLVCSVLDGYNVCIFAYGQTGSGKTYTMEGMPSNPGVNYRSVSAMFAKMKSLAPQYTFKVHVSLLEIYNEHIRDLLDSEAVQSLNMEEYLDEAKEETGDVNSKLEIRKGPQGMYVTNTKKFQVRSPEEVIDVLRSGAQNRAVGFTNANDHSSRSHSILILTVEGVDQVSQNRTHGKLYLVDLAGSERVKHTESAGQRLVEATYINKSLSALGDVMTALSNSASHVPYRNSKLTFLLQDSLGGNSKTLMFVNVSPVDRSVQESVCSLQFARRVRKVRLTVSANVENATLEKYRQEAQELAESRKSMEEKIKKIQAQNEQKLKEKEDMIHELNEQLKQNMSKLNQADLARKKELAELASQQARLAKLGSQTNTKATEERLQKKYQALSDKYEHVQQLLKLSQRENKQLKEDVGKRVEPVKKEEDNSDDNANRRARVEALAKKHSEDGAVSGNLKKKSDDQAQIIKVLRNKNRQLFSEIQQLKTAMKREQVDGFYTPTTRARNREARTGRPTTAQSGTRSGSSSGTATPSGPGARKPMF